MLIDFVLQKLRDNALAKDFLTKTNVAISGKNIKKDIE